MPRNPLDLPPVEAAKGYYAVDDPDVPGRLTAWHVDKNGLLHRFPSGKRWEPDIPASLGLIVDKTERHQARNDWYADVYRSWKVAVIEAISADPGRAAEAFSEAYPESFMTLRTAQQRGERKRRDFQIDALVAAALAALGENVTASARRMSTARSTARDRIATGRRIITAEPATARAVLVNEFGLHRREFLPVADGAPIDLDALVAGVVDCTPQPAVPDDPADR